MGLDFSKNTQNGRICSESYVKAGTDRALFPWNTMTSRITILGSGAWGLAMAQLISQRPAGHAALWCHRSATAERVRQQRGNPLLLPGIKLSASVAVETDASSALEGCELLLVAVPTAYLAGVLKAWAASIPAGLPVISMVKGIERDTFCMPTAMIAREWGTRPLGVLSGPSHAEEVARGLPAAVVVASEDPDLGKMAQERIMTDRFRIYTNSDRLGVEWAGALKNVIGIAAGICDGLSLGDNAKAALLTRGLAEMARSGVAQGADPSTFAGLAGMGDLLTTCFSPHGRNRRLGFSIGQGESLETALGGGTHVVEGVNTVRALIPLAESKGWDIPICRAVFDVLFNGVSPREAVEALLVRAPRSETSGAKGVTR